MKTFALGDIHGELEHLLEALAYVSETAAADRPEEPVLVVFLGDMVDRGKHSKQVLDVIRNGPPKAHHVWVPLLGNHDDMFLRAMRGDPLLWETWMNHGGAETLQSFGLPGRDWTEARDRVDPVYKDWLGSLSLFAEDSKRIFVHAGLMPGVPLLEQSAFDMLWIRKHFMEDPHDFGKLVVHGHTPTKDYQPEYHPGWRCNLDTKCGKSPTGRITVAYWAEGATDPVFWQTLPGRRQPVTNSQPSYAY